MQQYSKVGAAGLMGSLITILIPIVGHFSPDMAAYLKDPTYVAAVQTFLTGLAVYFAPENH